MVDVAAGQTLSAALFNDKTRKLLARARRTTNSTATTSTTEVGVLRLDDIPLRQGRNYEIRWVANFDVNTAADALRGLLRYTTDGSTPSTSSTILPGSGGESVSANIGVAEHMDVTTDYTPAADEIFSCLLTVRHAVGTSSSVMQADSNTFHTQIYITDNGDDPGDTGTDI